MPCYSPLKGYKDAETGGLKFKSQGTEETMDVACGQCLGCRLDRSRMWAARISHEAAMYEFGNGNSFVTLTYRPKSECSAEQLRNGHHIPDDWNLRKEHFQKFMKRLRKRFGDRKIKYYHCGEYGNVCRHGIDLEKVGCPLCNLGRPHYHAIIFNLSFEDRYQYAVQGGVKRYTSPILEKEWKYGFVDVGEVTYQSAAYVARYVMKKVTGENAKDHYKNVTDEGEVIEMQPEYSTMSNGIGLDWYNKYKGDVFPHDEVPTPQGIIKKVPRYYEEKLKEEDPEQLEEIKERRMRFREENADEYSSERLHDKYRVKRAATKQLKRDAQ